MVVLPPRMASTAYAAIGAAKGDADEVPGPLPDRRVSVREQLRRPGRVELPGGYLPRLDRVEEGRDPLRPGEEAIRN